MIELLDRAAREVSYVSVLVLGTMCLVAAALTMVGWTLKKLIQGLGLYRGFLEFLRNRRKM
jgi:hypothetical protein